ncbi:MAG TPA: DUF4136 domain-containing protein [Flavobacterium sp.]|nr:DUF4136 domain-containing protein [Flavobacterium sp.]
MNTLKNLSLVIFVILTSCSSIQVNSDYDNKVNFDSYKTYAYLKSNVDKLQVSDLDKKRILYSIDDYMITRGFKKSESPDMLVSIFTTKSKKIDVVNNNFWGMSWGWSPWWGIGFNTVYVSEQGTLFIDFYDAKSRELIWQGEGSGSLSKNVQKKDAQIKQFVEKILKQYPPTNKTSSI